ncbi:hypothetical protein [Streptomonospora salina]|uniref:2OGFeDO JBP1/TET oxygenase domain-containing protein n=1 Tax=Streptomonospora salina TaxID=104205 RepID=A0A841E8D2_9ACTN|nr:hypothetical protein [Streptomonospora salina]MBB6000227.1 hypothetical protein [Streptomonospora salina]
MIELRLRNRAHPTTVQAHEGRLPTDESYGLLLTQPARVLMPDGRPLCIYLPGHLRPVLEKHPDIYDVLHGLRSQRTDNRGLASGTRRVKIPGQTRTRARNVSSAIVGSMDPSGQQRYCRLTAWTGEHLPRFRQLAPLLESMSTALAEHVPDRYEAQAERVAATHPDWIVPGTVFSTVTVNNSYPTGGHKDAGDLAEGFSTLAVLRRGDYSGGRLVFPEYRVAADMDEGDLLLMDAHQWHANTAMTCPHGAKNDQMLRCCGAERISVVAYYRERMNACGSAEEEQNKAIAAAERRNARTAQKG